MTTRELAADLLATYLQLQGFGVLTVELREARRGPSRRVKVLTLEDSAVSMNPGGHPNSSTRGHPKIPHGELA